MILFQAGPTFFSNARRVSKRAAPETKSLVAGYSFDYFDTEAEMTAFLALHRLAMARGDGLHQRLLELLERREGNTPPSDEAMEALPDNVISLSVARDERRAAERSAPRHRAKG